MDVRRRWSSFNQDVTDREALCIPYGYRKRIFRAMYFYGRGDESKSVVQDYGGGILAIKDNSGGQGRCLFFARAQHVLESGESVERLVALVFYKKESQDVPKRVLELARRRLKEAG